MAAGIDYGMGLSNIDHTHNVRYGVIPARYLASWYFEAGEYIYPEPEEEDEPEEDEEEEEWEDCFCDDVEPYAYVLSDQGFETEQSVGSYAPSDDVFVTSSHYYTYCRYCSPCAPGAGYLLSQDREGIKAYCPPPTYFEQGQCPINIYRLDDGKLVRKADVIIED